MEVSRGEETIEKSMFPKREEFQWRPASILCKRFDLIDPYMGKVLFYFFFFFLNSTFNENLFNFIVFAATTPSKIKKQVGFSHIHARLC